LPLIQHTFTRFILATAVTLSIASCRADSKRAADADDAADAANAADAADMTKANCVITTVDTLPSELREASGIAASRTHPGILWAHNDGGNDPALFALDTLGRIHGRARIRATLPQIDPEDVAIARCDTLDCVYLADIGDNYASRDAVRILRFPEPLPDSQSVVPTPDVFPFRYPDGPHDAEAIFVLPGERVFVVTKGRNAAVAVFAYPGPLRSDTVTLLHMQDLSDGLVQIPAMVTGAAASPDGSTILLRTYSWVRAWTLADGDSLRPLRPDSLSLDATREFQGEGVAVTASGTVWLVAEQGFDTVPPPLTRISCTRRAVGGTEDAPMDR
jgi:hypothetical protein